MLKVYLNNFTSCIWSIKKTFLVFKPTMLNQYLTFTVQYFWYKIAITSIFLQFRLQKYLNNFPDRKRRNWSLQQLCWQGMITAAYKNVNVQRRHSESSVKYLRRLGLCFPALSILLSGEQSTAGATTGKGTKRRYLQFVNIWSACVIFCMYKKTTVW